MYKFEKLEVWKASMNYLEIIYEITEHLPKREKFNLNSQLRRAATSICLNIAEGSMGQTNKQQLKFLSYSIRSSVETAAVLKIIEQRRYLNDPTLLEQAHDQCQSLTRQLYAFRHYLKGS